MTEPGDAITGSAPGSVISPGTRRLASLFPFNASRRFDRGKKT
jgi:hypothetical protein